MARIITSTASLDAGFSKNQDPRLEADSYGGRPGINYRRSDPEYRAEFGTDRVIASAERVAFDAAIRAGVIEAEWLGDFTKFDIEVHAFTAPFITATFTLKDAV